MNVQLKKGVMEIVVLSMLQRKDFYGYELDTYLAESHNGPPRKYYRITDAGRAEFQESVKEWTEFNKAVRRLLAEGGESYA